MNDQLDLVRGDAESLIPDAQTPDAIESLRVQFLGKKGRLTSVLRGMGALSKEERPTVGKLANEVRDRITELLDSCNETLTSLERETQFKERLDLTLPGKRSPRAGAHPITQTSEDILSVLAGLGFERAEGPEVEHDFYNFEALNMPADHPARDMQDTFYVEDEVMLRTHTSPVQIRTMLALGKPPVRAACYGRVYRRDEDPTHSPMFHQVEGLYVDKEVTFGDLKGTLQAFTERIFAPNTKVRLRPSFFPFTEPSVEVDISCFVCDGHGEVQIPDAQKGSMTMCSLCKGTGWIEIMGAGMVDPAVFESAGFDPEEVTGFAFGIGVERVAMLRYGIKDIATLFRNDQRFLGQFL
ncbi:MAG: phenylalanine--tRNA ligase subunit alpha [Deltaproteobacteria bacterium]|nr:phenylalanine--tRNA ligase subunit alpha [Deltaproteobacteria bacterium]